MSRAKVLLFILASAVSLLVLVALVGWLPGEPQAAPAPTLSPERRLLAVDQNQRLRPVQALYHLEALAAETGWTPAYHRLAGDLWSQLGDQQQAVFHWEQAPQTDPLLLRNLAQGYLHLEAWPAARDTLQSLLQAAPDDPWANFHLGMLLAPYDPASAEVYLRQAALDPAFHESARAVRVTLLEQREEDALGNVGVPILVGLAMIAQEEWQYAELAMTYANTLYLAANGDPLPEALAYKSLAQNEAGKDGTRAIQQAVALRPDDPQIRFLEALHLRHVGLHTASLDAMIQAVALSPENPVLYAELGTAYRLTGDLDQAEHWLRVAVAFSDNDPTFQRMLASFYTDEAYNLGTDGLVALDSAVQNNPEDPDLLAGMGWAFYTLGDHEQGRAFIEQALELAPGNIRAQYYLARVLLGTGEDPEQALTLLAAVAAADGPFSAPARRILTTLDTTPPN